MFASWILSKNFEFLIGRTTPDIHWPRTRFRPVFVRYEQIQFTVASYDQMQLLDDRYLNVRFGNVVNYQLKILGPFAPPIIKLKLDGLVQLLEMSTIKTPLLRSAETFCNTLNKFFLFIIKTIFFSKQHGSNAKQIFHFWRQFLLLTKCSFWDFDWPDFEVQEQTFVWQQILEGQIIWSICHTQTTDGLSVTQIGPTFATWNFFFKVWPDSGANQSSFLLFFVYFSSSNP
jgi:hypothetical protein